LTIFTFKTNKNYTLLMSRRLLKSLCGKVCRLVGWNLHCLG